jgi:WS/DGAT/MGAT family acyltransferase
MSEPMSGFERHMTDADALMWHIEKDPILRSTIVAVGILDQPPDWARLRERYLRASIAIPRFRQRVLSPPMRLGPPRWAFERDFDLDFHLKRFTVPAPGTRRQLLDLIAPIAQSSFDRARPLWETVVLDGLEGGKAAMVMKVHHSVTDGVGGVELLTQIVDLERDAPERLANRPPPAAEFFDRGGLIRESLSHTARRWMGIGRRVPGTVARGAIGMARDPLGSATSAIDTARSIGRALAPATAPMSPIMTARGMGRWLDALDVSLDDLKRAAKVAEGSLNDAFVAGACGGLARYHARHGADIAELRMTMPINIRRDSDSSAGNQFAPARFPVPLAITDPVDRMRAIRQLVAAWRREPALGLTGTLAGVLNRLPTQATTALFGGMLKCVDFVTSNVPGAPIPVYVAGAEVERFYAFGPPSGAGVNITLMSHVDQCCIGVVVDTAAVPDPQTLMDDLRAGYAEVVAAG